MITRPTSIRSTVIAAFAPALLVGGLTATLFLAPTASSTGVDECETGTALFCTPTAGTAITGPAGLRSPVTREAGYWPFSTESGDLPAPEWVME